MQFYITKFIFRQNNRLNNKAFPKRS